jgi:hypothetical protein
VRDADIRGQLYRELHHEFGADPSTRIINELGLCLGACRVDVALVNGALHGFEIKSDADTLERLPAQATVYNATLDTVTLVCHRKHYDAVVRLVPAWWGITEARAGDGPQGMPRLDIVRPGRLNCTLVPESVAQLLWRDEVLELLGQLGAAKGMKSQPRRILWARLASVLSLDELRARVRQQLKSRAGWPTESSQRSGDDWSRSSATARDSQTARPSRTAGRTYPPS